ncbi:hypothetical protein CEE37_14895 [candidate division LCP-89 bacterium B3_LCP]|uniref:Secretion system C-terminal sorting domain-containing protein n=1 Tax=candidate division LCP-89 bacterium B3_LCP TaxID=2012998 RepID=A0A532UNN9_UNCL8|nr:MAG: hypothetical protein CEE37_14895 [candidate division LCP-89 bacterium B3_LCP]
MKRKAFVPLQTLLIPTAILVLASITSADTYISGGDVYGNWTEAGSPYIIQGDITIPSAETLNITYGVEVRFEQNTGLSVYGSLLADGTDPFSVGDTVFFTSTSPPGSWDGIHVEGSGSMELIFSTLEYGNSLWTTNGLLFTDCRLSIPVCEEPNGLDLTRCLVTVSLSSVGSNPLDIEGCTFEGNLEFMYNAAGGSIANSTLQQNLSYCTGMSAGTLQLYDSQVNGSVVCFGEDCIISLNGCTIQGAISTTEDGSVEFNNSTAYSAISVINTNPGEYTHLDIINSTVHGQITIDWVDVEITGSTLYSGIGLTTARRLEVNGNTIHGILSGSISAMSYYDANVINNKFVNAGIDISGVFSEISCYVHYNEVTNCLLNGISVAAQVSATTAHELSIVNNTVYNSGGNGISISKTGSGDLNTSLTNNIVSTSGEYGIYVSDFDSPNVSYNDVWNSAIGDYSGVTPGIGSISLDPQFIDPGNGDLNLQRISPCIDAGDPSSPFDPDGTIADMGAFYFHQDMLVKLTLIPDYLPIVIPETGGEFGFTIEVTNLTLDWQSFDFWSEIELPGWGSFEVLSATGLLIAPGFTAYGYRLQQVPDFAPAGTYTYLAYVGTYPWIVDDYYYFFFEKEGSVEGNFPGSPSYWFCAGKGFEGLNVNKDEDIPSNFVLNEAYPNPFNPTTTISYQLPATSLVSLSIYDISGRQLANLVNGWRDAGNHEVTFDASELSSGMYIYHLQAGDFTDSGKMILMK